MKVALDTNFLAYAEGVNDAERRDRTLDILAKAPRDSIYVPVQVLGELFNVLVRKAGRTRPQARDALLGWRDAFAVADTTASVLLSAADLSANHQIGIWDAVTIVAAAEAGCRLLLSEDLADGFTWSGLTIVNPFTAEPHPLLAAYLMQD